MSGEGDHLRRRAPPADLPRRPQPTTPGHANVEQDDIGALARGHLDRVLRVVGGADEVERRVGSDEGAEDVDHGLFVVGDHDSDRGRLFGLSRRAFGCAHVRLLPSSEGLAGLVLGAQGPAPVYTQNQVSATT